MGGGAPAAGADVCEDEVCAFLGGGIIKFFWKVGRGSGRVSKVLIIYSWLDFWERGGGKGQSVRKWMRIMCMQT